MKILPSLFDSLLARVYLTNRAIFLGLSNYFIHVLPFLQ